MAAEPGYRDLTDARIVLIGGAGFVGSHLVDQLLEEPVAELIVLDNFVRGCRDNLHPALEDRRVSVVEGSVLDRELLREVMRGTDYVFHLAALWLYECVNDPRSAIDVNAIGTFNVLEAAGHAGVKKLIFSSSASVYGNAVAVPMTEEHPFHNRTMYGATKIAGEQFCRAFYEQHGLDYIGLRYMNIYGPRMDDKGAYVSVIMKVLERISAGCPPVVFGDGSQSYDFVYVLDVARANVLALKSPATDVFLNVGTGVQTTINELVHQLLELTDSGLRIEYLPQEQMFVTTRIGSTQLATSTIGFSAKTRLQQGLAAVVDWQRSGVASVTG